MIILCSRLLKKILNPKSQLAQSIQPIIMEVSTSKQHTSFATYLAATLVAIDLESFQAFAYHHLKSLCYFDCNLIRFPFLGQIIDLDLLLCLDSIQSMWICFYALFLLRDHE